MAGELVLVTGGSGHLGYRIIVEALQHGYRVRAAVRSEAKAETIKSAPSVQAHLDKLDFVVVPDILAEGAYDNVLDGVTYILHAASPIAFPTDDYDRDLIQPAVKGTVGILKSAARVSTVKRVVITSSEVAIIPWKDFFAEETGATFTDSDTIAPPLGPYSHFFEAYAASKVLALHASNKFIEEQKPSFDVINIMPAFIIGKNELVTDPKHITDGTNGAAFGQILGAKNPVANPGTTVHLHDVALVQVRALNPKIPGGQNFLISSGGLAGTTWADAVDIVKKHYPEQVASGILPLGGEQRTKACKVDSSRTEDVFGLKLKSYEEQVRSVADHYLELIAGIKA